MIVLANAIFDSLKTHSAVPPFLWQADTLLLPPPHHHPSAAWTSPLKLGKYLASGTSVVATDIPALRAWVTDKEVEFVLADNGNALAEGIRHVLSDKTRNKQLQRAGIRKAKELSYERRAQAILDRCGLVACG